jgi:hypothetical protein
MTSSSLVTRVDAINTSRVSAGHFTYFRVVWRCRFRRFRISARYLGWVRFPAAPQRRAAARQRPFFDAAAGISYLQQSRRFRSVPEATVSPPPRPRHYRRQAHRSHLRRARPHRRQLATGSRRAARRRVPTPRPRKTPRSPARYTDTSAVKPAEPPPTPRASYSTEFKLSLRRALARPTA